MATGRRRGREPVAALGEGKAGSGWQHLEAATWKETTMRHEGLVRKVVIEGEKGGSLNYRKEALIYRLNST